MVETGKGWMVAMRLSSRAPVPDLKLLVFMDMEKVTFWTSPSGRTGWLDQMATVK
jgi:hypothetical protein